MTETLESGQVVAARYALQRLLGHGPRCETWLARDAALGRDVALKFAADSGADSLAREIDIQSRIAHPSILPAGRIESADGRTFVVMDYQPGGDLSRLRGRAWPFVLRRVLPVIDALGAVHAAGYVHCDVKSANVLLDADGLPWLADFSSARAIGTPGTAEGSPYGMSPQRYAGEPAAVTDDVYAVGVLIYKLVSGHPPFYPDITPQRVRDEVPPPLTGRPPVPPGLADLVARCLAKDAAQRPGDMKELGRELRECLELPIEADAAPLPGSVPQLTPPVEVAPIRAAWQRESSRGPSASELRREGFRRGLLVGGAVLSIAAVMFVFFVLPGLMQAPVAKAPTAASTPATEPPAKSRPALPNDAVDLERLAGQKRQAEELRGRLDSRLAALEKKDVASWGAATLGEARAALAAAEGAVGRRDYAPALASLQQAEQHVATLEKQAPVVLRQLVADGQAALDSGRSADATQKFAAALRVDAANAAAAAGMKRARVLDDVLKEVAAGARAEQAGDATGAKAAYQRALTLDPATRAAREGIARLQAKASGDAFAAAMAQGLAALARKDYPSARAAFEQAGRLRPGAPEVADGLQQIEQAGRTRDLGATLARARAAEKDERWAEALAAYREALKGDPTLVEGQQGVERCEPRAMLDAQLQTYLTKPERLFSQEGRSAARAVLAEAQALSSPGARLAAQAERLAQLVRQAETPIHVALASDNLTDVQVYRVGKLGAFERRDLELMPGRYTVVGTRNGYRDVRKEFTLLPGAPSPEVVVRCEDPI